jgi:hypothetical protein
MDECYQKPQPPLLQFGEEHFYRCYSREELH